MKNSAGIVIPRPIQRQIGAEAGDELDLTLDDGRIILAPRRRARRPGWADAARGIAAADDDRLVWPEFANDDDARLTW